ncbi:hypothetical protein ARMSODRAFT_956164 [Armillaria solidipes]|uniref:Uncharacterized protein n=1 Tax=Armillaria solidipes TaxID=1076256 RepID=A0A2H3BKB8_9AGAR|nr:hypothetical protein ARMSODRAFT_956164 [Armillaria solidipes]
MLSRRLQPNPDRLHGDENQLDIQDPARLGFCAAQPTDKVGCPVLNAYTQARVLGASIQWLARQIRGFPWRL